MIDFSGFKEFERASRESFIQLWQHAHGSKEDVDVTFRDPKKGYDIRVDIKDGTTRVFGFPAYCDETGDFPIEIRLRVTCSDHDYEFAEEFGIRGAKIRIRNLERPLDSSPFFQAFAGRFPGAVLKVNAGEA